MYKRQAQGWRKHLDFIILDTIIQQVSFCLGCQLRLGRLWPYAEKRYLVLGVIAALTNILTAISLNTMRNVLKRGWYLELKATLIHVLVSLSVISLLVFFMQYGAAYSRIASLIAAVFHVVLGVLSRKVYKRILIRHGEHGERNSMLVVSTEQNVERTIDNLTNTLIHEYQITGIILVDQDNIGQTYDGIPVVETIDNAADYMCREWIDEVLIENDVPWHFRNDLLSKCCEMGVTVHVPIPGNENYDAMRTIDKIGNYMVVTSSRVMASPFALAFKRSLDILGGLVGSLIALIIMAFVGPMIKKASPGPILYKSERIGKNGRHFKMYKLRSMYPDAEKQKQELMAENRVTDGMMFKLDFDPRVIGNEILPDGTKKTGIGEMIRRMSLDEFPQFFNVLKGEMSLVGTRPPTPDEWEKYKYHHRARLATKPGITGLWQVSGRSAITDFEEVVKLDTEYIYTWNLGKDIKILLKTIVVVLQRKGAI